MHEKSLADTQPQPRHPTHPSVLVVMLLLLQLLLLRCQCCFYGISLLLHCKQLLCQALCC